MSPSHILSLSLMQKLIPTLSFTHLPLSLFPLLLLHYSFFDLLSDQPPHHHSHLCVTPSATTNITTLNRPILTQHLLTTSNLPYPAKPPPDIALALLLSPSSFTQSAPQTAATNTTNATTGVVSYTSLIFYDTKWGSMKHRKRKRWEKRENRERWSSVAIFWEDQFSSPPSRRSMERDPQQ